MNETFQIVYKFLKWVSQVSGFTYHEVNVIVYFFIIPAIFVYLLGRILKKKYLILVYGTLVLLAVILIADFTLFSTWIFERSVDFLNGFGKIGLNYIQASVVICVIVPFLISIILLILAKKKRFIKNIP
jgi:hypothetical protein